MAVYSHRGGTVFVSLSFRCHLSNRVELFLCVPFVSFQRHPIGERSLSAVNLFLDSMAKEARNILSQLCPDHIQLNQQVSCLSPISSNVIDLLSESRAKILLHFY